MFDRISRSFQRWNIRRRYPCCFFANLSLLLSLEMRGIVGYIFAIILLVLNVDCVVICFILFLRTVNSCIVVYDSLLWELISRSTRVWRCIVERAKCWDVNIWIIYVQYAIYTIINYLNRYAWVIYFSSRLCL